MSGAPTTKSKTATVAVSKSPQVSRPAAENQAKDSPAGVGGTPVVRKTRQGSIPFVFVRPPAKNYVQPSKKKTVTPVPKAGKPVVARISPKAKTGKSSVVKGSSKKPVATNQPVLQQFVKSGGGQHTTVANSGAALDIKTPLALFQGEYALAMAKLATDDQLRKNQITNAAARERKRIQQSVSSESAATSRVYSDTTKAILATPAKARMQAMKPLTKTIAEIFADGKATKQKNALTEQALAGKLVNQSVQLMVAAGTFGNKTNQELRSHVIQLRGRSGQSVFEIASWYKNSGEYTTILEDLGEMSTSFGEGLDEVRDDVIENVNSDISDLRSSFSEDANDSISKLKEAREQADESVDELVQGGVQQLPEFINSVITELQNQATSLSTELIKSMGESLAAIREQGNKATAVINKQEAQALSSLTKAYSIKKKEFVQMYSDVMKQLPDLPDTLVLDLLNDAREGIRRTLLEDRLSGDHFIRETDTAMRNTTNELVQQLVQNTKTTTTNLTDLRNSFVVAAMTSLEDALQQMRNEVLKQLQEVSTKFAADGASALAEASVALQQKYTEAVTEIVKKTSGAKAALTDSYAENRKGMEKAAYKIVNDTFWDKVGDFFSGLISGILEFLGSVILGIIALVVAIIAIAVALAVLVAAIALLVYGLALLVTYGLAMLAAMMPFILKGIAIILFVDGALSLVRGIVLIYEALTEPGLSFSERLSKIGDGLLEIASVVPVGKIFKAFKHGGRFMNYASKVASRVSNSRIGKAIVEMAQHNFDLAGMLITKLGNKVDDIVTGIINGKIDKWSGILVDKLLNGKWTGPLLSKVKPVYDKAMKYGDDAMAVARGEVDDVAERLIRDKIQTESAKRVAANEAKDLVEHQTKKKLVHEGEEKLTGKALKQEGKKTKRDEGKNDSAEWQTRKFPIHVSSSEVHHLQADYKSESNYDLIVRSTPRTYAQFVSSMIVNDEGVRTRLRYNAKRIDTKMDHYRHTPMNKRVQWSRDIIFLMNDLAELTEKHVEHVPDNLPKSIVKYDGVNESGFGMGFIAPVLSSDFVSGQEAKEDPDNVYSWGFVRGLRAVAKNPQNRYSVYIKGHLLNAGLGGKANPSNLTPITQEANHAHLNVEKIIKKFVKGKSSKSDPNPTPPSVAYYRVKAIYGTHGNSRSHLVDHFTSLLDETKPKPVLKKVRDENFVQVNQKPLADLSLNERAKQHQAATAILTILKFENTQIAKGLTCSWHQLQYNNETRKYSTKLNEDSQTILNTLPMDAEPYINLYNQLRNG